MELEEAIRRIRDEERNDEIVTVLVGQPDPNDPRRIVWEPRQRRDPATFWIRLPTDLALGEAVADYYRQRREWRISFHPTGNPEQAAVEVSILCSALGLTPTQFLVTEEANGDRAALVLWASWQE